MAKIMNICVLGDSYTGKSSIINSFVYSNIDENEDYSPTIESKSNKIFSFDKTLYNLNIYDTAGSNELNNQTLLSDSIKKSDGFIIVYSLNDRESIDSIDYYRDLIKQYKYINNTYQQSDCPIILVANKMDLTNEIVISKTESNDLGLYYKMPIVESSFKNLNSIHTIFNTIIKEMLISQTKQQGKHINRKLLLKKTKSEYKIKRTKSEHILKKKNDLLNYFKSTFKEIF